MSETRDAYQSFLVRRHRPAHGRRTADRWAAFLLPHLRHDQRVLDVGCGPGSITTGLVGRVVGVDLRPVTVDGVPTAGADGAALPFADASFDAVFLNAVLQHVADPGAVVREARRISAPGAVIGIGDTDWGARIMHPDDPLIARGQGIQETLREVGDVRVGRQLRGLLSAAGFERVTVSVEGRAVGAADAVGHMAAFERAWFEAPEAVAHVSELGLSDAEEMAAIAAAWTSWSLDPAACATDLWFTALGWSP